MSDRAGRTVEAMVSCCAAGDMEKAPSAFCMHNSACCQLTHTMHTRPLPALPSIIRVGWMHTRDASQGITAAYSTHRGDLNIHRCVCVRTRVP